ncbi:hypothetical protein CEG14_01400 [Bordetella genomosp. 1]|uniref:Uncharacterized protein n=1 Tax=Bordetella genomosp. 1 TaxID=1395607 RepID=A0A261SU95_9BORD|nr:hypothetical protein [Bordetella genomosp. 1]OZI40450.1 hypothetical protein CEG14_01400 [Bordetella genomosp. 1]
MTRLRLAALLATLLTAAAAPAAQAANPCPQAFDVLRALYPGAEAPAPDGRVRLGDGHTVAPISASASDSTPAVVCKVWPADESLLLAAVPLLEDVPESNDSRAGDLGVYVLDSATLKVRHSLRMTGLLSQDAIRLNALTLDTARYTVAGKRAFGVRIARSNTSQPNPMQQTSLRLFLPEGDTLRLVLDGVAVASFSGEWDTQCEGEFIRQRMTLAMAGRNMEGTDTVEETRAEMQDGKCVESVVKRERNRYTFPLEDGQFLIPITAVAQDSPLDGG